MYLSERRKEKLIEAHEECSTIIRDFGHVPEPVETALFVEDFASKRAALDTIMRQYTNETYSFSDKQIENTVVIRIDIEAMTGKKS